MSRQTIRNFVIATIIFLMSVGIFAYTFYVISTKHAQLENHIKTVTEQQGQENSLFRLKRIFADSEVDRIALQEHFLVNQSDSIDFLNSIETLAPQVGVELETNSLNQLPKNEKEENWIEVQFSYSGSRESVNRFTALLENIPYVSYISNHQLSAETATVWNAETTVLVYVLSYES